MAQVLYPLGEVNQVTICNSPVVTFWRTESSNISLVVLDKLLYYSRNLIFFSKIFEDRPTNQHTDRKNHLYPRLENKSVPLPIAPIVAPSGQFKPSRSSGILSELNRDKENIPVVSKEDAVKKHQGESYSQTKTLKIF